MGLHDKVNNPIRQFAHAKISHPRHAYYGHTGTVVRIDTQKRKVWVQLPDGTITGASHRSIKVVVPQSNRVVK